MQNFWEKLPKPFFVMAPMADVTDVVFRRIIAECSQPTGPQVFFTEFVSADGLAHPIARERLLIDWQYSELERPIVAQMFGSRPENIKKAAELARDLGFDGIDINMGCPEQTICKQGAGAELMKKENYDLAREIIESAHEGASGLPVSVKTRMGYTSLDEFDEWFNFLLTCELSAITVHLRTKKEMSKVPAHWELASKLREFVGYRVSKGIPGIHGPRIIANGDVRDLSDARNKAEKYELDGVMLGRAIFGNPWLYSSKSKPDWPEVFRVMLRHAQMFQEIFIDKPTRKGRKPYKSFAIMRKHFGSYVSGHHRASEIKEDLMKASDAKEVGAVLKKFA